MGSVPVLTYLGIPAPHVTHEIRVHKDTIAGIPSRLPLGAVGKKHPAELYLYATHVSPGRTKVLFLLLGRLGALDR